MTKILICGASGTIGSELLAYLVGKGHHVLAHRRGEPFVLDGFDVVINLSGESIYGYWTQSKKEKIRSSRIDTTKKIVDAILSCKKPPSLFLSASATGYYGDVAHQVTEDAAEGQGFLADVCSEWEQAANRAKGVCRVVNMRFAMVLSPKGGALKKMLLPFKLGLGSILGSGNQMMSWVSIFDLLAIVEFCITNEGVKGPINISAPNSITNREFTETLAKAVNMPAFLKVPAWLLKGLLGEMAEEVLLSNTNAYPQKLLQQGYHFQHNTLIDALKNL